MRGKFLFVNDEKLCVRGVTYGTFRPREGGEEFPDPDVVERDFQAMAAAGINAVRTYTVPPRSLLDAAWRHGLRVMVGIPTERYAGPLAEDPKAPLLERMIRLGVRACAGHPALLCYAIGNEVPASMVRWYGKRRFERFIRWFHRIAKEEDPAGLVTYVSYPSTEYLELPFLDFVAFNVYLEDPERLEAYLARLHNLAGDRPLVLAEIGLDSRRNGEETQAASLGRQVRTAFGSGCAGAFVYAWTDEWFAGGAPVEDWDFGLTRRDRGPKPALEAVRFAYAEVPFPADLPWPRISVVVCSCNGARTLRECCRGLRALRYPDFEVIVIDDGSDDDTALIARKHGFRVISTRQCGLSHARNVGLAAATGEIVAYIDDDAYPDPDWLSYLAASFLATDHAGIGGPNLPQRLLLEGGGDRVARDPGGP